MDSLSFNTLTVILGTAMLGLACGVIGTFAVLRKRALVGDALAHAALPGICCSFLVFQQKELLYLVLGALFFGLLSVACINSIRQLTRIKEDAAIAIVLSSFFGLGIVISRVIQNTPMGNKAGLDDFIFGKAASMVTEDLYLICVTSLVTIVIVATFIKELKLLCFDSSFGWALGFPMKRLDYLLMGLIALCTVVGLPAVGVVLVSALLIFPGATARLWTDSFEVMVLIAGALGMTAAVLGSIISAFPTLLLPSSTPPLPTGPIIVLSCALFFIASCILSPKRGLLSRLLYQGEVPRG